MTIRFQLLSTTIACLVVWCGANATWAQPVRMHLDRRADRGLTPVGLRWTTSHAGRLLDSGADHGEPNRGAAAFDGRRAILYGPPSNLQGYDTGFTWEGFFLSAPQNQYAAETGIADRLVTQFAFDKGNWTRLAIGLVAAPVEAADRQPRLAVELEGFDGRTFGRGEHAVSPGEWHHFALVHRGTADAARIEWFLDFQKTGEILLGGQADQNTLRPPGTARFTFGARLRQGDTVNRGFHGLLDELRFTPEPLEPREFLRTDGVSALTPQVDANDAVESFWRERHRWAAEQVAGWPLPTISDSSPSINATPDTRPTVSDDLRFLRRATLDLNGRVPTVPELRRYLEDTSATRRRRLVDRLLQSPEWADAAVPHWQDLLAENPSVVYPTLNNSGAFRDWIYWSMRDNLPLDRFAAQLISMSPQGHNTSTAGFALATGNDAPLAMRSNVLLLAFAGLDLKCARCHDAPFDDFRQEDLFRVASYLNDGPLQVPASSLAAAQGTARPLISTSLTTDMELTPSGETAKHLWPGVFPHVAEHELLEPGSPRSVLAAAIVSARTPRFSDLAVQRMWKRLTGKDLITWDHRVVPYARSYVLDQLSRGFVASGYDLKWLAREIVLRPEYQQGAQQRKMSAEQLVDSMFTISGKTFRGEVLGVHATDPGAVQLPRPERAWQFASLPNERDRPALGMPVNQTIVDVLTAYGWNGNRQHAIVERTFPTTPIQPLMLRNGLLSQRIVRLSDAGDVTAMALHASTAEQLVEDLFLRILTRYPTKAQRRRFTAYLADYFPGRRTGIGPEQLPPLASFQPDWRKHLQAEQTELLLESQRRVAIGEPPTRQLTVEFRERVEDIVWALLNSPEFVIIP